MDATTEGTESAGTEGTGSHDTSTDDASTADTGTDVCGNGIVEAGEQCDDEGESAQCDADCSTVVCGDSIVNAAAGEECDHLELSGATCVSVGFDVGMLGCSQSCAFDTSECQRLPSVPLLALGLSQVKQFEFSWAAAAEAEHYQLLESPTPGEPFVPLVEDIVGESISITMPLHLRFEASYVLRACNEAGCVDSEPASVAGSLAEAVGYFKASNADPADAFGISVASSDDGDTVAVGAYWEASSATGIGGNQSDDSAYYAGAVYVFARDVTGQWLQRAYIKGSNTEAGDWFGRAVALSGDGDTLAVGASWEGSSATGINGNQADDSLSAAGAVYVFVRDEAGEWSQQAYVKASNTGQGDWFGRSVALSGNGNTLVVGAHLEASSATGIDGDQSDDSVFGTGAVYVFARDGADQWSQQAYVKASNVGGQFGDSVALSSDGDSLAVGADGESSSATGIDGDQEDGSAPGAGAVYVFVRNGADQWSQQAYVKASNTGTYDRFGDDVALSSDGNTLAVGADGESSGATGIDGNQNDDSAPAAGAVYVFVRDATDQWSQQAYVKASNTHQGDRFGGSVALSGNGDMLVVGAEEESSNAVGIGGDQANASAIRAGAVYVLVRDPIGQWSQQAYVKAPNTNALDFFGSAVALSNDGGTLVVGAENEGSSASGIGGDQADDGAAGAGAVYLY